MAQLSVIWLALFLTCHIQLISGERSFKIDLDNNQFLKDGQPFRYISGSLHYFRVPRMYWEDRLKKMLYAGLNAVQTDVDWSQHYSLDGKYHFSDNLDLIEFIQLAQRVGLSVILRPGPYIDADRDLGGLPYWLLTVCGDTLRTSYGSFMSYVNPWFNTLLPMVKPLLYANGGPIISVQIENKCGSFGCDSQYMTGLYKLFRTLLGDDVILFSNDLPSNLYRGKIQSIYATVSFVPGTNVSAAFANLRAYEPKGPLVTSEYYVGSVDQWSQPHNETSLLPMTSTMNELLYRNASFNIYMFHGGTNFGFTNGAVSVPHFSPFVTSYDYGAPISEAGDLTDKYFAIRNLLALYVKLPTGPVPDAIPKYAYGSVQMKPVGSLFDVLPYIYPQEPVRSDDPKTFESLYQASGFVLYEVKVTSYSGRFMDPTTLESSEYVKDRAIVFVDQFPVGLLSRQYDINTLSMTIRSGQNLSILVENMGRVSFGLADQKGLLRDIYVDGASNLFGWSMTLLPLNESQIDSVAQLFRSNETKFKPQTLVNYRPYVPGFFMGTFVIPYNSSFPMDTYLNVTGWRKGVAFVNNINIGRYWPVVGPQVTLYVPKSVIKLYPNVNEIILFELESAPCHDTNTTTDVGCVVEFVDKPMINSTTPKFIIN